MLHCQSGGCLVCPDGKEGGSTCTPPVDVWLLLLASTGASGTHLATCGARAGPWLLVVDGSRLVAGDAASSACSFNGSCAPVRL